MATIVLVHGSFSGGWIWRKVTPDLTRAGHTVLTPTMTGLGERRHLSSPDIGLDTHIQDIANVLFCEDLQEVMLVGHSWGGMVISGVAETQHERIARLVYLDAFVPMNDQSVFDISSAAEARWRAKESDGFVEPHDPASYGVTDPEVVDWITARRMPMPIKGHEDRIHLPDDRAASLPRSYIWCTESAVFEPMARLARSQGCEYYELPTHHMPMVTMPKETAEVLLQIAANQ